MIEKKEICPPKLLGIRYPVVLNSLQLTEDVIGEVIGDSLIECWARYIMPNKKLVAKFDYIGDSIKTNGLNIDNSKSVLDYSKPVKVTVYCNSQSKDYKIFFTLLPVYLLYG